MSNVKNLSAGLCHSIIIECGMSAKSEERRQRWIERNFKEQTPPQSDVIMLTPGDTFYAGVAVLTICFAVTLKHYFFPISISYYFVLPTWPLSFESVCPRENVYFVFLFFLPIFRQRCCGDMLTCMVYMLYIS